MRSVPSCRVITRPGLIFFIFSRAVLSYLSFFRYSFDVSDPLFRLSSPELLSAAQALNDSTFGDQVTYVINRNINFTNICNVGCTFCGFQRNRSAADAFTHSIDTILEKVEATPAITEVCIQGGINPDIPFSFYLEMIQALRQRWPDLHLHAFSPMELEFLHRQTGQPIKSILNRLLEAGLNTIPGTAAEILDDQVRAEVSGNKLSADRWETIIRTAHQMGIRSTATIMFGHIETWDHIENHFARLRSIQEDTGGFTEFIPLAFIPFQNRLGQRVLRGHGGDRKTFEAVLLEKARRLYPLARLYFQKTIPRLQTSWVKLGPALAAESLAWGCNDFGGTLFEESITRESGGQHGECLPPEEIQRWIRRAGKVPHQRDTLYGLIRPVESLKIEMAF